MSKNYFGGLHDFSDVLFLKQKMPDVHVFDVTGKHAQRMINELQSLIMFDIDEYEYPTGKRRHLTSAEYANIERHIERYKAIMYRHEYWIPDTETYYFDNEEIMQLVGRYGKNVDWHKELQKKVEAQKAREAKLWEEWEKQPHNFSSSLKPGK